MKANKLNLILCILMVVLCGCESKETIMIDAEVLTVNSEILEGKLISQFLSGSSGWLKSDVIKVGVKFEMVNQIFLEDLELSHAQLAYYKDRDTLPLTITVKVGGIDSSFTGFEIRLCGYYIKNRRLDCGFAKKLIEHLKME